MLRSLRRVLRVPALVAAVRRAAVGARAAAVAAKQPRAMVVRSAVAATRALAAPVVRRSRAMALAGAAAALCASTVTVAAASATIGDTVRQIMSGSMSQQDVLIAVRNMATMMLNDEYHAEFVSAGGISMLLAVVDQLAEARPSCAAIFEVLARSGKFFEELSHDVVSKRVVALAMSVDPSTRLPATRVICAQLIAGRGDKILVEVGGVLPVVACLQASDANDRADAVLALSSLSQVVPGAREVARHKPVAVLLRVLEQTLVPTGIDQAKSLEAQRAALRLIANIEAVDGPIRAKVVELGGLRTIAQLLSSSNDADLLLHCARVVANAAVSFQMQPRDLRARICESGVIEPLLALLRRTDVDALLQRHVARSLRNISSDRAASKLLIAVPQVISTLAGVIAADSKSDAAVQASACIANLSDDEENCLTLLRGGVLDALRPLVLARAEPDSKEALTQLQAAWSIANCTIAPSSRALVCQDSAVVGAMVHLAATAGGATALHAYRALVQMSREPDNSFLGRAGVMPVLLSGLQAAEANIQALATSALLNVAGQEGNLDEVLRHNVISPLVQMARSHTEAAHGALVMLASMSQLDAAVPMLLNNGAHELFLQEMQSGEGNARVAATAALAALSANESARRTIGTDRLFAIATSTVARANDVGVQRYAAMIVLNLTSRVPLRVDVAELKQLMVADSA